MYFFLDLVKEIEYRRIPEFPGNVIRPVMIFFESAATLLEFYLSQQMESLRPYSRTITEIKYHDDAAFLHATVSGAISLIIRDFGRGTDFKCLDNEVLDSGGIHVIQSFFSAEISEEIIKGRTARQGCRGSYR